MNKFKYCLQIRGLSFSCLGSQVSTILSLLPIKGNWYLMDIRASNSGEEGFFLEFENTESLTKYTSTVDQFLSGVFLLIEKKVKIEKDSAYTEDPPFHNDLKALLEIRAFDTSWLEVYTDDYNLAKKLYSLLIKPSFELSIKLTERHIHKFSDISGKDHWP